MGLRVVSSFSLSQTPLCTSPAFRVRGDLWPERLGGRMPGSEAGQPSGRLVTAQVLSEALYQFTAPPVEERVTPGGSTALSVV